VREVSALPPYAEKEGAKKKRFFNNSSSDALLNSAMGFRPTFFRCTRRVAAEENEYLSKRWIR